MTNEAIDEKILERLEGNSLTGRWLQGIVFGGKIEISRRLEALEAAGKIEVDRRALGLWRAPSKKQAARGRPSALDTPWRLKPGT